MTDIPIKERGILIVGSPFDAKLEALKRKAGVDTVVFVDGPVPESTIEINSVKYRKVDNKKFNGMEIKSVTIDEIMGSRYSIPITNMYRDRKPKERKAPKDIDVIAEFTLIQQKKSKLSRFERDWVVKMFNKSFVKAEQGNNEENL